MSIKLEESFYRSDAFTECYKLCLLPFVPIFALILCLGVYLIASVITDVTQESTIWALLYGVGGLALLVLNAYWVLVLWGGWRLIWRWKVAVPTEMLAQGQRYHPFCSVVVGLVTLSMTAPAPVILLGFVTYKLFSVVFLGQTIIWFRMLFFLLGVPVLSFTIYIFIFLFVYPLIMVFSGLRGLFFHGDWNYWKTP